MGKHQKSKQNLSNSKQNNYTQQQNSHNLLQYYKQKVDSLNQQRLSWLSKFDQCNSKLKQKHSLKQSLLNQKNQSKQINRSLVHHHIALFDQKLNVIRMQRQNLTLDYNDAEQLIKITQLMQQYPQKIQKQLPCSKIYNKNGQLIQNQLNIHSSKQKRQGNSISKRKPTTGNNYNINNNLSKRRSSAIQQNTISQNIKNDKITPQQLLQRQIIQIKRNQDQQIQTLNQLTYKLQDLIKKTKNEQKSNLNKQRQVVDQINKQYKNLQKKHKLLSQEYFNKRRQQKIQQENIKNQNHQLLNKHSILQEKINKQIKIYQKQNKAKQTLIIKKSQDFQENYKAKMKAKQINLQALKQNYQKMQTVCIQKVTKLQKAFKKAKSKFQQATQRRDFLISQLRQQLNNLQKQVQTQKNQRQQRQLKLKIKIQKQKQKNEQIKQKQQKQQARYQRNRLVDQAYKKTVKKQKSRQKNKRQINSDKFKPGRRQIYGKQNQQSQDDESIQMDDLENIKKQIGELQNKIAADTR